MKTLGIGPVADWNFFSSGRTTASIEQARAAAAEAALVYRETVLNALHDVETSWSALEKEQARSRSLTAALDNQKQALELSHAMYEVGKSDYLDVLTAQASYLSSQKEYATHIAGITLYAVELIKSLGGGWNGTI